MRCGDSTPPEHTPHLPIERLRVVRTHRRGVVPHAVGTAHRVAHLLHVANVANAPLDRRVRPRVRGLRHDVKRYDTVRAALHQHLHEALANEAGAASDDTHARDRVVRPRERGCALHGAQVRCEGRRHVFPGSLAVTLSRARSRRVNAPAFTGSDEESGYRASTTHLPPQLQLEPLGAAARLLGHGRRGSSCRRRVDRRGNLRRHCAQSNRGVSRGNDAAAAAARRRQRVWGVPRGMAAGMGADSALPSGECKSAC